MKIQNRSSPNLFFAARKSEDALIYLVVEKRSGELLVILKALTALLLQALLALGFAYLDEVVLSPTAALFGVDGDLVAVAADVGSGIWAERHGLVSIGEKNE